MGVANLVVITIKDGRKFTLEWAEPVLVAHGQQRFSTIAACNVKPWMLVDFKGLGSLWTVVSVLKTHHDVKEPDV